MRLGLSAKFTITVLVILLCTMAANTLYFLGTSTRLHEQQLLERGRALGRLVSLISPEAILGFDFLLLNDYTREVSSQPDVAYGANSELWVMWADRGRFDVMMVDRVS